ncbi:MAG TPA: hypothetical protein DCS11_07110 [Syntrophus sp. (in: bacteria)]|nr:hypothetical protein [Syntrophus sp. (in: bacteria)]
MLPSFSRMKQRRIRTAPPPMTDEVLIGVEFQPPPSRGIYTHREGFCQTGLTPFAPPHVLFA